MTFQRINVHSGELTVLWWLFLYLFLGYFKNLFKIVCFRFIAFKKKLKLWVCLKIMGVLLLTYYTSWAVQLFSLENCSTVITEMIQAECRYLTDQQRHCSLVRRGVPSQLNQLKWSPYSLGDAVANHMLAWRAAGHRCRGLVRVPFWSTGASFIKSAH